MAVWNFAGQVHLFGSLDASFLTPVDLGSFDLSVPGTCTHQDPLCAGISAQILSFSSTSAQYIRMQILTGGTSGLGEVAFGVASVPEPTSFSLVVAAAFALCLGSLVRKRRASLLPWKRGPAKIAAGPDSKDYLTQTTLRERLPMPTQSSSQNRRGCPVLDTRPLPTPIPLLGMPRLFALRPAHLATSDVPSEHRRGEVW